MKGRRSVGLDRPVRLGWMDAAAHAAAEGAEGDALRTSLNETLAPDFPSGVYRGSREKTVTVLVRTWGRPDVSGVALRSRALELLPALRADERLWLHWGMMLVAYPFFRDGAGTVGRLFRLQGQASTGEVARRMTEAWGQRATVETATPRFLKTLVDWRVVEHGPHRGLYRAAPPRSTARIELERWLVHAALRAERREMAFLQEIRAAPWPGSFPSS